MDVFRVPRREVPVRILLDDQRTLDGLVFTAMAGPDGMPGRVVDRLNDTAEDFIPLACGEDRFLLNKSGIVAVQVPDGRGEVEGLEAGGGREVQVQLSLSGGIALSGRLFILMPPERSRVLDFLNASPWFFALLGADLVTLIHKRYVVSVLAGPGE